MGKTAEKEVYSLLRICIVIIAGCSASPEPRSPLDAAHQFAAVQLLTLEHRPFAPGEELPPELVALESWTKPAIGTRWSLVDARGVLGEVVIFRVDSNRQCDHCPRYRSVARPLHRRHLRGPFASPTFAIGPLATALSDARMLTHNDHWWTPGQMRRTWIPETVIDIDGDGTADLVRRARGPHVMFEVRIRIGAVWKTTQRWSEPYVLDDMDAP